MKKLLLLLLTPTLAYSQIENIESLLKRASDIQGIDMDEVGKVNPQDKEKILNLDKIKKADRILLDTKIDLLQQAKIDLFHELALHKIKERMRREAENRELRIADAWQKSRTGRIDGRSWFDLFEDERKEFRKLYFDFHNK